MSIFDMLVMILIQGRGARSSEIGVTLCRIMNKETSKCLQFPHCGTNTGFVIVIIRVTNVWNFI